MFFRKGLYRDLSLSPSLSLSPLSPSLSLSLSLSGSSGGRGRRGGLHPPKRKKGWPKGVKRGPPKWRLKERRTGFKLNLYTPPETPMEPDRPSLSQEPREVWERSPAIPNVDAESSKPSSPLPDPKPDSPLDPFSQDDTPVAPGTDDDDDDEDNNHHHEPDEEQKAEEEQGCSVRVGEQEGEDEEEPAHNEDHDADDEDDCRVVEPETDNRNVLETSEDLPSELPPPYSQDADVSGLDGNQDDRATPDGGQATPDSAPIPSTPTPTCSESPRHPEDSESEEECGRDEGERAESPAREGQAACAEVDPETAQAVQSLTGETEQESGFQDCVEETQEACRSLQGYTHLEQSPPAVPVDEGLPSEHSSPVSSVQSHPGQSVRSVSSLESGYTQISPAHSTVSAPSLQNLETSPMMDVPSVSDHSQQVADSGFSDLGSIESTTENYENPSSYDSTLGAGSTQSSCSYGNLPQSSCAVTQQLAERANVGGAYSMSSPQGCISERPPSGHQPLSHFALPPAPHIQLPEMMESVGLGLYDPSGKSEYSSGHYTQPSATFSLAKLQQLTNGLMDPHVLPFSHSGPHHITSYHNSTASLPPPLTNSSLLSHCPPSRHAIHQTQTMTPPPNLTPPPAMLQRNIAMPNSSVPPSPQRLQSHTPVRAKSAPLPPNHHHHHHHHHYLQQQQQIYSRTPHAVAMQAHGRTLNIQATERSLAMQAPSRALTMQASERTLAMQAPKRTPAFQAPDRTLSLQGPERTLALQGPERTLSLQAPERTLSLQGTDRTLSLHGPERTLSLHGPERTLSLQGPERTLSLQGPERTLSFQGPERTLALQGPERTLALQGPGQTITLQASERTLAMQATGRALALQGPGRTLAMQGPDRTLALQSPGRTLAMQASSRTLAMQGPERTLALQSPGRALAMQGPDRTLTLQSPGRTLAMQASSRTLAMQGPERTLALQSPGRTLAMQASSRTLAMQGPDRTLTLQSPGRAIAMPRMNMGVNLMPAPAYNVNTMNVNVAPLNAMNGYRMTQPMMNSGYHANHAAYMNQSPQYSMQMGMMGSQPYSQQPLQAPPHGNMMYTPASRHGYINGSMSKPPLNPSFMRP